MAVISRAARVGVQLDVHDPGVLARSGALERGHDARELVRAGGPQIESGAPVARLQLVHRPVGHDLPRVEHGDAAGQRLGLFEVLRGEEDRGALRAQRPDLLPQRPAALRVKPCGRLVQEQRRGAAEQGGGDVQPPLHAAGIGADLPVRGVREREALEQVVGLRARVAPRHAPQTRRQQQVLATRHAGVEGGLLHRRADAAADRGGIVGHGQAEHGRVPRRRRCQRREDAHRRGLAGAVAAEQAEHLATSDLQIDAVERLHRSIALGELADLDGTVGERNVVHVDKTAPGR